MNAPVTYRQINCSVPTAVYLGIEAMSKKVALKVTPMAERLLMAAYTAKCAPTGDRDLDAAVAALGKPGSAEEGRLRRKIADLEARIESMSAELAQKTIQAHGDELTTLRKMIEHRDRTIAGLMAARKPSSTDDATEIAFLKNQIEALKAAPTYRPTAEATATVGPSPLDTLMLPLIALHDTVALAELLCLPEAAVTNAVGTWRMSKRRAA